MPLNNSRYDEVMRIIEQRRLKNTSEQEERIQYIYSNVPGYREADDELSDLRLRLLKDRIMKIGSGKEETSDDSRVSASEEKIEELIAYKAELLKKHGYPADYTELKYDCPLCKDTGYVNNVKCSCFKKIASKLMYEDSNLSVLLSEDNFDNLSYEYYKGEALERFKKTVDACKKFVENFGFDYENLLFYGTVGTGKSFLSGCIAKELLDRGHQVVYFSSAELFSKLSDIMFERGERAYLLEMKNTIYDCELLIVDDLGTEFTNNLVAAELFSLLNERHLRRKPTIVSTNLDLKDLKERYADRIFSRVIERYSLYKFIGEDIREIKKKQKI